MDAVISLVHSELPSVTSGSRRAYYVTDPPDRRGIWLDNGVTIDQATDDTLADAIVVVNDHIADTVAAHAATAISASSTTLVGTAITVQGVLEELDDGIADHLADTSAAHAATAIAFTPVSPTAATTVQAAIEEVVTDQLARAVRSAAGVPAGAPTAAELPLAYDSTAVTGGFYFWSGAAWVKVATIL